MANNKKRRMPYGLYKMVAEMCDCSPAYVKMVLAGRRASKTTRAKKEKLILIKYNEYQQLFNNN